jgi:hypothetical protein
MRIGVVAAGALLASCAVPAAEQPPLFDGQAALEIAAKQVALGPRIPGSAADTEAADQIKAALRQAGWSVEEQSFVYHGVRLTNVIGMRGPRGQTPIILGTHYDTRPLADRDPIHPDEPVPGADDGASGVAVLLGLAKVLQPEAQGRSVWLAFFDGEDSGNIAGWSWSAGSTAFAQSLTVAPSAVVIVDMVGDKDLRLYLEHNSDQALAQEIWDTAAQLGYSGFIDKPGYGLIDDHTPFLQRGFPAVDIIDFDYPAWHTTGDTLDKLSAASLEQVGRTLQAWLTQSR